MTIHPPDLMRKLSKKIDQHKAVQLSPAELDLLVECGAFDRVCEAATEFQRKQCRERSARNRSISEAPSSSTRGKDGTTKSYGTTDNEGENGALARAQLMTGRQ